MPNLGEVTILQSTMANLIISHTSVTTINVPNLSRVAPGHLIIDFNNYLTSQYPPFLNNTLEYVGGTFSVEANHQSSDGSDTTFDFTKLVYIGGSLVISGPQGSSNNVYLTNINLPLLSGVMSGYLYFYGLQNAEFISIPRLTGVRGILISNAGLVQYVDLSSLLTIGDGGISIGVCNIITSHDILHTTRDHHQIIITYIYSTYTYVLNIIY